MNLFYSFLASPSAYFSPIILRDLVGQVKSRRYLSLHTEFQCKWTDKATWEGCSLINDKTRDKSYFFNLLFFSTANFFNWVTRCKEFHDFPPLLKRFSTESNKRVILQRNNVCAKNCTLDLMKTVKTACSLIQFGNIQFSSKFFK